MTWVVGLFRLELEICSETRRGAAPCWCGREFRGLVDQLELFSGFEANSSPGCDADFGSGAGVSSYPGFAWLHVEDAEAAEFDAVVRTESVFHGFKNGVNG